ncbi:hypothetical protein QKU48_gp0509 [Fadolivirus algeromassiliense]|jgi:hypothetical protein|uniref:Uncharacterized protein n=1 Tax=Fadolivirus FV1/VV64 TaxID=3070911 RepID=A0A7D3QU97_9VIRU|nr:hypothetical protein QKU48_gp0509 [Fadolivirus algeromassiliense]QKF93967.1 hypothetical protein Fadolivirus_1_509 [Fadolivirus FV1/VV64]
MDTRLSANPQFYDYLHSIIFQSNGTCNFIDGAGQCICLDINGTYLIHYGSENKTSGYMEFNFDNDNLTKHFSVNFRVQEGLFVMVNEIVWNSKIKDWPVSVYNQRYVFDNDPFEGLYQNREKNLYFILEGDKEVKEEMKYFYGSSPNTSKKMDQLTEEELNKVKEIDPQIYMAFIKNPNMDARGLSEQK